MIAKAPAKGKYGHDTQGLLRYLFGPGRSNEHTNPHLVAAWDPDWLAGGAFADQGRGWLPRLAREIDAAMTGHDITLDNGHVYHVSISIPSHDGQLGDARWRELIEEAVERMGFGPTQDGRAGCRWVAVHHGVSTNGNDHVHLAVNLVRGDGTIADTYRDRPRWRHWCMDVEQRLNLTTTSPADRTATPQPTRAETEKATRRRLPATSREHLRDTVRTASIKATSAQEFIALLTTNPSVVVQARWNADTLTGYRVGLKYDTTQRASHRLPEPIWFSGSTLARDLSAPKLTHRWAADPQTTPTPVNRRALLTEAHDVINTARQQLTASTADPDTADGIAHATFDLLTAAATVFEYDHGRLTDAARAFEQAARTPHRVQPHGWHPTAVALRTTARQFAHIGALTKRANRTLAYIALITALAALIAEIAAWREHTGAPAGARAARHAQHLLAEEAAAHQAQLPAKRIHEPTRHEADPAQPTEDQHSQPARAIARLGQRARSAQTHGSEQVRRSRT